MPSLPVVTAGHVITLLDLTVVGVWTDTLESVVRQVTDHFTSKDLPPTAKLSSEKKTCGNVCLKDGNKIK